MVEAISSQAVESFLCCFFSFFFIYLMFEMVVAMGTCESQKQVYNEHVALFSQRFNAKMNKKNCTRKLAKRKNKYTAQHSNTVSHSFEHTPNVVIEHYCHNFFPDATIWTSKQITDAVETISLSHYIIDTLNDFEINSLNVSRMVSS